MKMLQRRRKKLRDNLALVAGGIWIASFAGCHSAEVSPLPPPAVQTAPVMRSDSARELRVSGTIEAERSTALSFAVPGTVEQVLVDVGQPVHRGQVVAKLTPTSLSAALGISLAQKARAEDMVKRLEPMHRNKTVPEVKWVEAQTSLEAANNAVEIARKNLSDTELRAPEDGVIARRAIEPGATVAPGIPALELVQTRVVRAVAPVPENQVARIRVGQRARVGVGAIGREFTGEVHEVSVLADPLTRTYPVKITLANPEGVLKVGMVVDAFLPVPGEAPSPVVPREAVRIDGHGSPCVFVVGADNKVQQHRVKVAGFVGERIAIEDGLKEGDLVVVSGTPMLADGVTVRLASAGERSGR